MSGLIMQYAYQYTDANRQRLKEFNTMEDMAAYLDKQPLVENFVNYAETKGMQRRNLMIEKSRRLFTRYLQSRIIYNMLNENALMKYLNRDDQVIKEALDIFSKGVSRPSRATSYLYFSTPPCSFSAANIHICKA